MLGVDKVLTRVQYLWGVTSWFIVIIYRRDHMEALHIYGVFCLILRELLYTHYIVRMYCSLHLETTKIVYIMNSMDFIVECCPWWLIQSRLTGAYLWAITICLPWSRYLADVYDKVIVCDGGGILESYHYSLIMGYMWDSSLSYW